MYGNGWKDNVNGTFTSTAKQSGYSPLDLYLMGMISKDKVPPMLLIDNPAIDKTQLPLLGATITGTAKTVTIDDIIAAEGARVPDAASSPKKFNIGFVLLTRPGDNATTAVQAIETVRTAFAGRFAELTQGTGGVNGVTPSISVVVDSPADGATITGPDVTVTGVVINSTGAETGITVNGMPATASGSRFIVNHVPLQEGINTITVTATDINALTATTTCSLTAEPGNYIQLKTSPESGVAPLSISLTIIGSFPVTNPVMSYSGPVTIELAPGASPTDFTMTLPFEGTYNFTASAVGPDGKTYSSTITIIAENQAKMDSLIRAKWNSVNNLLSTGDTVKALSYFTSFTRDKYQAIFNEVKPILGSIIATYREFNTIFLGNEIARYKLITLEDGKSYAYDIVFEKEENGLWLLRSY